jgi:predicted ATPase
MTIPTTQLTKIRVEGFRSLKSVALELGPINVLIGPNGAGKSNLLWAIEMVRLIAFESLQLFVSERGGATYLMHYGPKVTPTIEIQLEFTTDGGENAYEARLGYGADESLIFLVERAGHRSGPTQEWRWHDLGAGHRESNLKEGSNTNTTAKTVRWLLRRINFYHFHDTSRTSPLRTKDYADASGAYLRSDGSNLATFLDSIRTSTDDADKAAWRRIEGTVRRIAPFITAIAPTTDRGKVRLEWVDDRGATFGPAHLSDGTLRALALIAALAQPHDRLPLLSSIDEPELGLHPAALDILCSMISVVATHRQVIVATQAPAVLDQFGPEAIVVAERSHGETVLRRLDENELAGWLEEYSLSELYDKNVLGGRP